VKMAEYLRAHRHHLDAGFQKARSFVRFRVGRRGTSIAKSSRAGLLNAALLNR
jgi:hypothetical protein